jgi:hypothetical protein
VTRAFHLAVELLQRPVEIAYLADAGSNENLQVFVSIHVIKVDGETWVRTAMIGYVIHSSNISKPRVVSSVDTPFVDRTVKPPKN